ncbi:MAG: protein-tyrosine kinase [Lachnospiraceae bacterium]|nr:protein-tyrosine kinase [Lachnospiraceae bacterium]
MEENTRLAQGRRGDSVEIDLGELLFELWVNKWELLLATVFGGLLAFFLSACVMTPKYTSVTSLYVLAQQDNETITTADLTVGAQLTNDYAILVTSRPVLEQTIAELGLDMTTEELGKLIHVENETNTRILKISVSYTDPLLVRRIADSLRNAVGEQIVSVMNIDAVNTVEEASLPTEPSEPGILRNTLIGLALGFFLSAGFLVIRNLLDDTVKTAEDVEHYLGLPVLGTIPDSKSKDISKAKV